MKRGSKAQLKRKILFFIAIFSIALFVFPEKVFAYDVYIVEDSVSWHYKQGHLYLYFVSDTTTDELEVHLYNWYSISGSIKNMLGKLEEDFSVIKGFAYSKPVIWAQCDDGGTIIENALGLTPAQFLTLPCISTYFVGDGSHYIDEITYDFLQTLKVWKGASLLTSYTNVFFLETPLPPTLSADYPETGTTTELAFGSFTAEGDYACPGWQVFVIEFSTATTSYAFSSGWLEEDTGSYSIPVDLFYAGTYDVRYIFYRYAETWGMEGYYYIMPIATTTLIVNEGMGGGWYDFIQPDIWEEEEPATGTVQHYIWSIQKFFRGLFVLGRETKAKLVNTILKVKTRFPYSYVIEIKDFFTDIESNIEDEPTVAFTILNATGTAYFFDANITIGSETKSFADWIKILMMLLLVGGFTIFIINFMRKIFK